MARQTITPVHLPVGGAGGTRLLRQSDFLEAEIQALVHGHPELLPLAEIDPAFDGAVAICRELQTPAGPIDNLLLTPSGLPVIVECKLWRNPQARREVVGQILDYAKELARFTSADLEREAARRGVPSLVERLREVAPDLDETRFHDTLSRSLQRGRFLLLIVGDGISANVEALFEHLATQGALHFSFGLVEMPIFALPDGGRLAVPRVIARTGVLVREVVALPPGHALEEDVLSDDLPDADLETRRDYWLRFWSDFVNRMQLDDPEQPRAKPERRASIAFSMPIPDRTCWLTLYRMARGEIGLFLGCKTGSVGERVIASLVETSGPQLLSDLGGTAQLSPGRNTRLSFSDKRSCDAGQEPSEADLDWLAERTNRFINVLRPAVRSAARDLLAVEEH